MGSSTSPSSYSIGAYNHVISVHTIDSGIDYYYSSEDANYNNNNNNITLTSYEIGMRNMLDNYQIESVAIQQAAEIEALITETLQYSDESSSTWPEQLRTMSLPVFAEDDQRQPHDDSEYADNNSLQRETSRNSIVRTTTDAIETEEEEDFNNDCYESMYWNLVCNICNHGSSSSGFRKTVVCDDAEQDVVLLKPTTAQRMIPKTKKPFTQKTLEEECVPRIQSQKNEPHLASNHRDFPMQMPSSQSCRTNVVAPGRGGGGGDGPIVETFLAINDSMKELETIMSVILEEEKVIITEDDGMEEELRALPYSEEILRQELAEIDQVLTLSFSISSSGGDSGKTDAEEALRRELAEADRLIASAYEILNQELDAIDHVIALSTSGSFERQVQVPEKTTTSKEAEDDDEFMNMATQPVCGPLDGWCSTEEAETTFVVFEANDERRLTTTPFASTTNVSPPESLRVSDPGPKQCQVHDRGEPNVVTPSVSFHTGPQDPTTKVANQEETTSMPYDSSAVGPNYSISDPTNNIITEDNLSHSQNPSDEKSGMHLSPARASTFPTSTRHNFMPARINKARSYNHAMPTSTEVEATTPELQCAAPHTEASVLPLQPPAPAQPFLTSTEGDEGVEVSSISSSSSSTPDDQYVLKFGRTDSLLSSITASDESEVAENKLSATAPVKSQAPQNSASVLELAQNMSQELWEGLARDFATFEEELRDICDASAASPITPYHTPKIQDMPLPRNIPVPRRVHASVAAKSKEQFYGKSHVKSGDPVKAVNTTDLTEGTSQSDQIPCFYQVGNTLVELQTSEESKGCGSEKMGSETRPGNETNIALLQAQWYKQIGELERLGRKLMIHLGKMESDEDCLLPRTVDSFPCQTTNPPKESNTNVRDANKRNKIGNTASWSPAN
jgi:hypothetical protein